MKNPNDTIENGSRDLPVCSAVAQPLAQRVGHIYAHNLLHGVSFCFSDPLIFLVLPSNSDGNKDKHSVTLIFAAALLKSQMQYPCRLVIRLHS
jgi:hypothetical protein